MEERARSWKKRFAVIPKRIGDETVWLRSYEERSERGSSGDAPGKLYYVRRLGSQVDHLDRHEDLWTGPTWG